MIVIIALIAGLLPLLPALALVLKQRRQAPVKMTRRLVLGLSGLNLVLALMMIGLGVVWLFAPHIVEASGTVGALGTTGLILRYGSPSGGRGSASPLLGQYDIARSACAVMVSEGFTPRFAVIAEPSAMCSPGCPKTR